MQTYPIIIDTLLYTLLLILMFVAAFAYCGHQQRCEYYVW